MRDKAPPSSIATAKAIRQQESRNTRLLDEFLQMNHPNKESWLARLTDEVTAQSGRRRAPSTRTQQHVRAALDVLCANLFAANQIDPRQPIAIRLDANHWSGRSRYRNAELTYRTFRTAFYGLVVLGYVQRVSSGYYNKDTGVGSCTKICATGKLIDALRSGLDLHSFDVARAEKKEVIILRSKDKKTIEYDDTPQTNEMRANVKSLNKFLATAQIELPLSPAQQVELRRRLAGRGKTS